MQRSRSSAEVIPFIRIKETNTKNPKIWYKNLFGFFNDERQKYMKYANIFWDWNGTLVDDVDLAMDAANDMLCRRNREPITKTQYYAYIDTPIIRFYEHIFDFSQITIEEIMVEFNEYYCRNLSDYPLMKGAKDVLQEFLEKGIKQSVLSSSSNEMLLPYVEKFGLNKYFESILGASDNYCNGKTERAIKYIREKNINPKNCILIGDTLHDFDTACAIGCDCILIPNGHQSKEDLVATGATIAEDICLISSMIF